MTHRSTHKGVFVLTEQVICLKLQEDIWEYPVLNIRVIVACLWISAFPLRAETLVGTWEEFMDPQQGTMTIIVESIDQDVAVGSIVLHGSRQCKLPIQYRAVRKDAHMEIVSTESVVCEYRGQLRGTMTEGKSGVYTGTFSYHFWGGVWARGRFTVERKATPHSPS